MKRTNYITAPQIAAAQLSTLLLVMMAGVTVGWGQPTQQGREFHQRYEASPQATVSVSNQSGRIHITSWNEPAVQVDAIKQARRAAETEQIQIQVTADAARIEIRTIYPRNNSAGDSGLAVEYEIKVPQSATLGSITSANASIEIAGPVASITARTASGAVTVRDVTGAVTVSSASGNISAEKIGGDLRAKSASGQLRAAQIGRRRQPEF